jgi:hypothetical protein
MRPVARCRAELALLTVAFATVITACGAADTSRSVSAAGTEAQTATAGAASSTTTDGPFDDGVAKITVSDMPPSTWDQPTPGEWIIVERMVAASLPDEDRTRWRAELGVGARILDLEKAGTKVAGFSIPGLGDVARIPLDPAWSPKPTSPEDLRSEVAAELEKVGFTVEAIEVLTSGDLFAVSARLAGNESALSTLPTLGLKLTNHGVAWLFQTSDQPGGEIIDTRSGVPWIGVFGHWPSTSG